MDSRNDDDDYYDDDECSAMMAMAMVMIMVMMMMMMMMMMVMMMIVSLKSSFPLLKRRNRKEFDTKPNVGVLSIAGRSVHLGRSEFLVSQTKVHKEKKLNYQKRSFNKEQV